MAASPTGDGLRPATVPSRTIAGTVRAVPIRASYGEYLSYSDGVGEEPPKSARCTYSSLLARWPPYRTCRN